MMKLQWQSNQPTEQHRLEVEIGAALSLKAIDGNNWSVEYGGAQIFYANDPHIARSKAVDLVIHEMKLTIAALEKFKADMGERGEG